MSSATAAGLIEALRRHYAREHGVNWLTDEDLAQDLPFKLRQLARWKKNDVDYFDKVVTMLSIVGWLNEPQIQAAERRAAETQAREAEAKAARLAADSQSPAQDTRRSARGKR